VIVTSPIGRGRREAAGEGNAAVNFPTHASSVFSDRTGNNCARKISRLAMGCRLRGDRSSIGLRKQTSYADCHDVDDGKHLRNWPTWHKSRMVALHRDVRDSVCYRVCCRCPRNLPLRANKIGEPVPVFTHKALGRYQASHGASRSLVCDEKPFHRLRSDRIYALWCVGHCQHYFAVREEHESCRTSKVPRGAFEKVGYGVPPCRQRYARSAILHSRFINTNSGALKTHPTRITRCDRIAPYR
jgi:hypothetical protein